jgi:hypothetical protein
MLGISFQQEVLERLSQLCPVYRVGGAVRDAQLGIPSKDVDAVIALPQEQIYQTLLSWRYKPHQIGAKLQTVSLFHEAERLDLVSYSGNLTKDALGRDFTINAIYQDVKTGDLKDPLNGLKDLKERRLRTCGNAADRFCEDPLRVLRMIRFAVFYRLDIETETWKTGVESLPQLSMVSAERITEELGKILVLEDIEKALSLLDQLGFFQRYIPELARLKGLIQNRYHTKDAWEHTCYVVRNTPAQILLRLAALFHDVGKWETASRECYAWGTISRKNGAYYLDDFKLRGKNIGNWNNKEVEIQGGRLDNHPETLMIKHIKEVSMVPLKSFEWVPEGKRHFLQHERESVRLVREIFPRFRWSIVLPRGIQGERDVEYLVGHHMLGTLTFMNELKGEADPGKVTLKARRFAWEVGWNGQSFDPIRVDNLLILWQADFLGGKQLSDDDFQRLKGIQEEIRNACLWITQREKNLDWNLFAEFSHEQGLKGERFGRFKEQVRKSLMLDHDLRLDNLDFLKREYSYFRHTMTNIKV